MKRVLIAVDESPESHAAAAYARELLGDQLFTVICVAQNTLATVPMSDPVGGAYIPPVAAHQTIASAMHAAEDTAEEIAHEVDASADTIVESGEAGRLICEHADADAFDLIVVGSHDRPWCSRLLNRSVRDYLVHHAPCPVLVVRH